MPHVPVEERRPQLIEAAIRVVAREGVARATTRRIAEEAGAPLATLHYSFRNKEELFAAVTEHGARRSEEALGRLPVAPGEGLRIAVTQILGLYRDGAVRDPGTVAAELELQAWARRTPGRRELADRCYVLHGRAVVGALRAAASEADRGVDLPRLARLVLVASDGMALRILASGPSVMADVELGVLAEGLVATAAGTTG